jgi:hypothetical protein
MAAARARQSLAVVHLEASDVIIAVPSRRCLRLGEHGANGLEKALARRAGESDDAIARGLMRASQSASAA